jgi:hypothetical protein
MITRLPSFEFKVPSESSQLSGGWGALPDIAFVLVELSEETKIIKYRLKCVLTSYTFTKLQCKMLLIIKDV